MKALVATLSMIAGIASAAEPTLTADQSKGRTLFNESCSFCHGERGHATTLLAKRIGAENAVLEKRTNLNVEMIRAVVRHGINSMPWYRRAELPDRDLDAIAAYLTRSTLGK
jgi:(+)-pinoresinol hydroxylase